MKFKSLILLVVSVFVLFSCDDGIKFDNPNDINSDAYGPSDTDTQTNDDDSAKTDTMSEYDDEPVSDDSDSDSIPDDADSIDDSGDPEPDENNSDDDSADSVSDYDSDSTDSEPDDDEPVVVSRVAECSDIPENAVYNTVDEITQTWNGEEWIPSNESYFSETPSTTECRFKCKSSYVWTGSQCALPTTPCDSNPCTDIANSNGSCTIADSNYVCGCLEHYSWTGSVCKAEEQTKPCTGKPANSSWNTASQIKQTWNGEEWYPSTTAVYNTNASTTECRFKCNTNYSWNSANLTCVLTTQQGNCSAKPANTVWNDGDKNGKFDQTWNGATYTPASYTSTYNETAGICRFKCASAEYFWNGSECKKQITLGNICTGQTRCYNESEEITCPTSSTADFYGQDAQYAKAGYCYPQSFTVKTISGKNIVVDNNTGLEWQQTISEDSFIWKDALSHCENLEYGGYSDWRLPTPQELLTIVDNSKYALTIDSTYFPNMKNTFWTGQENSGDTSRGFYFSAYYGGVWRDKLKTETSNVICVRGNELAQSTFTTKTINGNEIVTDSTNNLMWQKNYSNSTYTWINALKYCENLTHAGYNDWRLPNRNEAISLFDFEKSNAPYSEFPDMPNSGFWSSSNYSGNNSAAWSILFYDGQFAYTYSKSKSFKVRCVRSEQINDPCSPNPCNGLANSTQICTQHNAFEYSCGCNSGYFWNGQKCAVLPEYSGTRKLDRG